MESQIIQLKLPDYKAIASRFQRSPAFVQDGEVEDGLRWLQRSRAKLSQVSRSCQMGDFVEIEFENDIDKQKHKDAFILGEGKFVPGFEDALVGMRAGEDREFSLRLPDDYAKLELRGREAHFAVRLHSLQQAEFPELNDDFARSLGNFDGLAALSQNVRAGLLQEKRSAESQRVRGDILEHLDKEAECEIPEVLVREEENRMMSQLRDEITEKLQISLEEYLAKSRQSEEDIRRNFTGQAEGKVRNYLIVQEIAKKEGVRAEEEEIQRATDAFLAHSGGAQKAKSIDPVKSREAGISPEAKSFNGVDPEQLRKYIGDMIVAEKTMEKLEEYVTN